MCWRYPWGKRWSSRARRQGEAEAGVARSAHALVLFGPRPVAMQGTRRFHPVSTGCVNVAIQPFWSLAASAQAREASWQGTASAMLLAVENNLLPLFA